MYKLGQLAFIGNITYVISAIRVKGKYQAKNIWKAAQIQTKSDISLTTLRILKVSMLKKFG